VEKWSVFSNHCYSVRVRDAGFPCLGTNGKGATRCYALASAYAEFIERLQGRYLVKNYFGLRHLSPVSYPDESRSDSRVIARNKSLFKLLEAFKDDDILKLKENVPSLKSVPFFNVRSQTVEDLPFEIIDRSCASTGLCAGNTPQEAIIQGICEIFERFVAKEAFYNHLTFPTIPISHIENTALRNVIGDFTDRGFHIIIKDCSLDGIVPVLCVIVLSGDRTRYRINFGSDPIFEIALLRCLNEVVQGRESDSFESSLVPLNGYKADNKKTSSLEQHAVFLQFLINGAQPFPSTMFLSSDAPYSNEAFENHYTDHRDILIRLVNRIFEMGYEIYVRDLSFLGFPTYRVYIPGMSEIRSLSPQEVYYITDGEAYFRQVLLRLKKRSQKEMERLAEYLEYRIQLPFSSHVHFYNSVTGIHLKDTSELAAIAPRSLLSLIYLYIGDYGKAYEHLQKCSLTGIEAGAELSCGNKTLSCLKLGLKLKSENASDILTQKTLMDVFGSEAALEVIGYLNLPAEARFDALKLPLCGECRFCPAESQCYYKGWERLEKRLLSKMKASPIKQMGLAAVFSSCH